MKKNIRSVQVLGTVMVTPALTGQPQAAAARSIDPVEAVQNQCATEGPTDIGKAWSIFDLSVVEKLKLGGQSIPALSQRRWDEYERGHNWKVAMTATQSPNSSRPPCGVSANGECKGVKAKGVQLNKQAPTPHTPTPQPHLNIQTPKIPK
jgi:hypothetical protein